MQKLGDLAQGVLAQADEARRDNVVQIDDARRAQLDKRKATLAAMASEADETISVMAQDSPQYALEYLLDWQRKIVAACPGVVASRKDGGAA